MYMYIKKSPQQNQILDEIIQTITKATPNLIIVSFFGLLPQTLERASKKHTIMSVFINPERRFLIMNINKDCSKKLPLNPFDCNLEAS